MEVCELVSVHGHLLHPAMNTSRLLFALAFRPARRQILVIPRGHTRRSTPSGNGKTETGLRTGGTGYRYDWCGRGSARRVPRLPGSWNDPAIQPRIVDGIDNHCILLYHALKQTTFCYRLSERAMSCRAFTEHFRVPLRLVYGVFLSARL